MDKISNPDEFLEEAKELVLEESSLKELIYSTEQEIAKLDKNIIDEKKSLQDQIDLITKKRFDELVKTYNDEHNILLDKIKKIKANREKAKNLGIKERVIEETKEFTLLNKEIKSKIKDEIKNKAVNPLVNIYLFRAIYYPTTIKDYMSLLLVFIMNFVCIPLIINYYLKNLKINISLKLVIIYLFCILLFGSLYLICLGIKSKYLDSIKVLKKYRKEINANNKQIKKIARDIKKDTNDDIYDLRRFDTEIINIEKEVSDLIERREEAILTFEKVTKNIIIDEISINPLKKIEELENKRDKFNEDLEVAENKRKNLALKLVSEYEVYLGKEFLNVEILEDLKKIYIEQKDLTINELIEFYNNKSKEQ